MGNPPERARSSGSVTAPRACSGSMLDARHWELYGDFHPGLDITPEHLLQAGPLNRRVVPHWPGHGLARARRGLGRAPGRGAVPGGPDGRDIHGGAWERHGGGACVLCRESALAEAPLTHPASALFASITYSERLAFFKGWVAKQRRGGAAAAWPMTPPRSPRGPRASRRPNGDATVTATGFLRATSAATCPRPQASRPAQPIRAR
jgi:hypothetical protein